MEETLKDFILRYALNAKTNECPLSIEEIANLASIEHERRLAKKKEMILDDLQSYFDTDGMLTEQDEQAILLSEAQTAVNEYL